MQEISRTGRIKGFLTQRRKAIAPLSIDTMEIKAAASLSPGSAGTPSTPVSAESPPTNVMLRLALGNVELHKMISGYAQKEYKYECVLVWDNIQRYKKAFEKEIRSDVAHFIFDTFVKEGTTVCSNTSKLIQQFIQEENFVDGLFDVLEREMEVALLPVFTKFSQSKAYNDLTNQGTEFPVTNRQTLLKRPSVPKIRLESQGLSLSINTKREMSPTVGSNERYVGSPTVSSPMLLMITKSPVSISSPTVGDLERFVGSPTVESPTTITVKDVEKSPPRNLQDTTHKRTASPRDLLASLLSFKKRKL